MSLRIAWPLRDAGGASSSTRSNLRCADAAPISAEAGRHHQLDDQSDFGADGLHQTAWCASSHLQLPRRGQPAVMHRRHLKPGLSTSIAHRAHPARVSVSSILRVDRSTVQTVANTSASGT